MAQPQLNIGYVDVRQIHKDPEQCRIVLVKMRPYPGIVNKDGVFKENASGMDALLVLLRALTAYGWQPDEDMSVAEAALCKTALMDLGWDEQKDKIAKGELTAVLGDGVGMDMFCSEMLKGFAQVSPVFQFIDNDYVH